MWSCIPEQKLYLPPIADAGRAYRNTNSYNCPKHRRSDRDMTLYRLSKANSKKGTIALDAERKINSYCIHSEHTLF